MRDNFLRKRTKFYSVYIHTHIRYIFHNFYWVLVYSITKILNSLVFSCDRFKTKVLSFLPDISNKFCKFPEEHQLLSLLLFYRRIKFYSVFINVIVNY